MVAQDSQTEMTWEVHLAGPGQILQRVALSLNAVSTTVWLLLFVLPPLLGGVWIIVWDAPLLGQIAYSVICLCIWLALTTIGASYQHVRYKLDASRSMLLIEREGYDPQIDLSNPDDNPGVPLTEVHSVATAAIPGHRIVRMSYDGNNVSRPNTVIVPTSGRSIWDALQQRQPNLPSLPTAANRDLGGYIRFIVTITIAGVLPLALLSEEILADVILISMFVIVAGLIQNSVTTLRRGESDRELSIYGALFVGAVKTLSVIVSVIAFGVLVNRLI